MRGRRRTSWWTRRGSYLLVLAAVLVTVAVVIAGMRLSPTRPDRPVTITTAEWAPYVSESLPGGGPIANIVRLVLAQQGYQATVEFTTWNLALGRAGQGQAFAAFPLVASTERDATFLRSDPLVEFEYVLFHDTTRPVPDPLAASDLADLRVARIAGYDYWPVLDEAVGSYIEFETSIEAFTALAAGDVDLVPEGRLAGEALLLGPGLPVDATRFVPLAGNDPWLTSTQELHLLVADNADGATLIRGFNAALAEVRTTPEYRTLVAALAMPNTGQEVRLGGTEGEPVQLQDDAGETVAMLPRGTRATVLEWPEVGGPEGATSRVEVKVSTGPGRGRVGYVDLSTIELVS